MRLRAIPNRTVLSALLGGLLLLGASSASAKPRSVLVLPFAPIDLGREEQWLGEAVAESLGLALIQVPALVQIDRGRLDEWPQSDFWSEKSALSAARALNADIALYGEVRRTAGELSFQPRFIELKGDQAAQGALEAVTVPEGELLERLKTIPVAYLRALKVPATDAELARVQKYAAPTGSARAYEAYIKGQMSTQRGTQEGNEAAVELLGRAVELDPQFVVSQYGLGVVHQTLGNRWKAAAQFRASTQLDPTYPEPYKALGDLFLTAPRRLFDQAIEAYNKALELRPYFADAYAGLGDASAAKGNVNGAVSAYQKALVHNPLNPRVYVSLGKIYYGEKQLYFEAVMPTRRRWSWIRAMWRRGWGWPRSTRIRDCTRTRSANTARWSSRTTRIRAPCTTWPWSTRRWIPRRPSPCGNGTSRSPARCRRKRTGWTWRGCTCAS